MVAKESNVSWDYAAKVIDELKNHGAIIAPDDLKTITNLLTIV
jgi:predicted transcriptional regulator